MDVEPDASLNSSAPLSSSEVLNTKPIRDLPPLSDFPPRPKSLVNTSTVTPQITTPAKAKEQEVLKAKEEQILAMQRRIAEMELKRASKRVTGFSSPESNHIKNATRSSSVAPQARQKSRSPSRPPIELNPLPAKAIESQPAFDVAEAIDQQQVLKPKTHHSLVSEALAEAEIKDGNDAKSSQRKIRIAELEQIRRRIHAEVESLSSKLQIARQEVTSLEAELQALANHQRVFADELDSLQEQEGAAMDSIASQAFLGEKETAGEAMESEPDIFQPSK